MLLTRGEMERMWGIQGRKYELWWSGNHEGYGGVGVLTKEELFDKVVEVRRVNDRVMSLAIVLVEEVARVVLAYAPHSGIPMKEIQNVYDLSREWTTHHKSEVITGMGDFIGHVGINIDGFLWVHGGFSIGERNQEEGWHHNFVMQSTYASPTHGLERLIRRR